MAVLPDRAGVGAVGRAWSFIILRNIVLMACGPSTRSPTARRAVRGLLSKRLRIGARRGSRDPPKLTVPARPMSHPAGRELSEVMLAMQRWGSQWAELTPEHAHPGVVLWGGDLSPRPRPPPSPPVLVRFDYPTLSGPGSRGWLLVERGDAEICEKHGWGEDWWSWSAIRWRSPAGISESSSGATPCAAGRSRCGAHARWRGRFPLERAVV